MAIEFYRNAITGGIYAAEYRDNGDVLVAISGPLTWDQVIGYIRADARIDAENASADDIAAENLWFLSRWQEFCRLSPMELYNLRPPIAGEKDVEEDWEWEDF